MNPIDIIPICNEDSVNEFGIAIVNSSKFPTNRGPLLVTIILMISLYINKCHHMNKV